MQPRTGFQSPLAGHAWMMTHMVGSWCRLNGAPNCACHDKSLPHLLLVIMKEAYVESTRPPLLLTRVALSSAARMLAPVRAMVPPVDAVLPSTVALARPSRQLDPATRQLGGVAQRRRSQRPAGSGATGAATCTAWQGGRAFEGGGEITGGGGSGSKEGGSDGRAAGGGACGAPALPASLHQPASRPLWFRQGW